MKIEEELLYCSFELSKMLKEKGFDVMQANQTYYVQHSNGERISGIFYKYNLNMITENNILRPLHALVIEWIKKVYNIRLFLDYTYYDGMHYGYKWVKTNGEFGEIFKDNNGEEPDGCETEFEATELAIAYILNNKTRYEKP